jgi:hypothetical protein
MILPNSKNSFPSGVQRRSNFELTNVFGNGVGHYLSLLNPKSHEKKNST